MVSQELFAYGMSILYRGAQRCRSDAVKKIKKIKISFENCLRFAV